MTVIIIIRERTVKQGGKIVKDIILLSVTIVLEPTRIQQEPGVMTHLTKLSFPVLNLVLVVILLRD